MAAGIEIRIVRQTGTYSLPISIAQHVEFITGLTAFPPPPSMARKHFREPHLRDLSPDDNQTGKVVPYVIAQDYGLPQFPTVTNNPNSSIVCVATSKTACATTVQLLIECVVC
jgi:hypothetical protein